MMQQLVGLIFVLIFAFASADNDYINCDIAEYKDDIYVLGNAIYVCNNDDERVEHCVICDNVHNTLNGYFIDRAELLKFNGADKLTTNEELVNFCNGLKNSHCLDIVADQLKGKIPVKREFCTLGKGTVRRYASLTSSEGPEQKC